MDNEKIDTESLFRTIFFDSVIGMSVVGVDSRFKAVNRAFSEYVGYSEDELKQKCFLDITHPDDVAAGSEIVRKLLSGEVRSTHFEKRYTHKNGNFLWAMVYVMAVYDQNERPKYFISQVLDIRERKSFEVEKERLFDYERTLRVNAEKAESRALFLANASASLSASLDYRATLSNITRLVIPHLADWCWISFVVQDSIQTMALAHVSPKKQKVFEELDKLFPCYFEDPWGPGNTIRTGKPEITPEVSDDNYKSIAKNQTHLELLLKTETASTLCVPLVARGRTIGSIGAGFDRPAGRRFELSDLKFMEELAGRCAIAIDNALLYQEAQKAIRLREEFISIASHELKTPLTPLKMQLYLLREFLRTGEITVGSRAPELLRLIEGSSQQVEKITRLVDEMLDTSQIRAGHLPMNFEGVDLGRLISNVIESLRSGFDSAKSYVEFKTEGDLYGFFDPIRMEQAITNLLTNAIKYGAGKPIKIIVQSKAGIVHISIQDFGIGIARADQDRIFEPFERATTVQKFGGMGLGLYIARRIIQAHGGSIQVESVLGKGSTFLINIPLNENRSSKLKIEMESNFHSTPPVHRTVASIAVPDTVK